MIKPLKIVIFGFAIYGISQLKYNDQRIADYVINWVQSKKSSLENSDMIDAQKQFKWAKDKAIEKLKETKKKISSELKDNFSLDRTFEPKSIVPLEFEPTLGSSGKTDLARRSQAPNQNFIPGTKIPVTPFMSERKQKILQKMDLENEVITGPDKKSLKSILEP